MLASPCEDDIAVTTGTTQLCDQPKPKYIAQLVALSTSPKRLDRTSYIHTKIEKCDLLALNCEGVNYKRDLTIAAFRLGPDG